ncbi:OmpA family protein [Dankookia sp. P2]|uniref:OmpA family protein n=1 Tax=Dankookia sp. P2 TaxID=3423955 RepID=UPI003D66D8CA
MAPPKANLTDLIGKYVDLQEITNATAFFAELSSRLRDARLTERNFQVQEKVSRVSSRSPWPNARSPSRSSAATAARLPALFGILAALATGPGLGQPASACAESVAMVRTALAEQGLDAAIAVYKARVFADCLGPEQGEVARALALRYLPLIATADASGTAPAAKLDIVRRGLALDATAWQRAELEGDLTQAAAAAPEPADFAAAFAAYRAALRTMTDGPAGQTPPRTDEIDRVARKMEQAGLLSEQVVPGAAGLEVVDSKAARNLTAISRLARPVYFREGTPEFTEMGSQAAAEILAMLRSRDMPGVRVIGHADARGSAAANERLSRARAQALVRYLERNGYPPGRATAEGRGSREPYPLTPIAGVTFTQPQRWQLDRRVEVEIRP